jgi:hypothetical protein
MSCFPATNLLPGQRTGDEEADGEGNEEANGEGG